MSIINFNPMGDLGMNRKIFHLSILLCATPNMMASEITEGNEPYPYQASPSSTSTSTPISVDLSTKEWIEAILRQEGELEEGEHLAPHEVWRIADEINKRAEEEERLQRPPEISSASSN
jgi:hypothetical protein